MSGLAVDSVLLLVAWGAIVALDLVSLPQALLARPLVAGTVAGWLAGDVQAGLRVGVLLELFALDVLPIGAARYPDYGPATVAGAALAAGAPWELGLGVAAALGLLLAAVGGWSLQLVRQWNAEALRRRAAALAAGEGAVVRALQYRAVLRDALRGGALTALGLGAAWIIAHAWHPDRRTAVALTLVAIGAALAAAVNGALRSAGRGRRLRWLTAGAAIGTLLAVLR